MLVVGPGALRVARGTIEAGIGGPGGRGGDGGDGSIGGAGGNSTQGHENSTRGAGGGRGGQGGCGGAGAGGHGGHTIALLLVDPGAIVVELDDASQLLAGEGGAAGEGGGFACEGDGAVAGPEGLVRERACCFDPDDCGELACPD